MISFTHVYQSQCDTTNKIIILMKQGTDKSHDIITMIYQKYHSTTILKHANVLVKVNKSP